MIQGIIIGILFIAAVFFMGRKMYRQYKAEDGCAAGCDSCGPATAKKSFKIPDHLKG